MEVELLEPEIIMATDQTGQSTQMACDIMSVKIIQVQGRPCSRLLTVCLGSNNNIGLC